MSQMISEESMVVARVPGIAPSRRGLKVIGCREPLSLVAVGLFPCVGHNGEDQIGVAVVQGCCLSFRGKADTHQCIEPGFSILPGEISPRMRSL
jgi:hypothetical protein